jgi:3-phenylpropionate/trans-cinnamate dioxygenase ferredoxin reductase subunit
MNAAPGSDGGPIVVVGAGHAGVQLVDAACRAGCTRPMVLVDAADELPYERPPLSKDFLHGEVGPEALRFHPAQYYADLGVELCLGTAVSSIDPACDRIRLADGTELDYHVLVLATGGRPRTLPIAGTDLSGVTSVATRADADRLRALLVGSRDVVLIGAGFIGLEVATAAARAGARAVVVDIGDRVLSRVASPRLSAHVERVHRAGGVRFELGRTVVEIIGDGGRARSVVLDDGRVLPADVVVVGAGMVPDTALAQQAGLAVGDGILVDDTLQTSRPGVYAIGDCARAISHDGASVRLESVQNATDQGRRLARVLAGEHARRADVPWFWSHQGPLKLQIAGLPAQADTVVTKGRVESGRFSLFWFTGELLSHVESVNHPSGHTTARRILAARVPLTPQMLDDDNFDLRALLAASRTDQ